MYEDKLRVKNGPEKVLYFTYPNLRGGLILKRRTIHQWRNWLLEYIGDDKYELIQKDTMTVFRTIVAKNGMDAENECQQIIKKVKEDALYPDGPTIKGVE